MLYRTCYVGRCSQHGLRSRIRFRRLLILALCWFRGFAETGTRTMTTGTLGSTAEVVRRAIFNNRLSSAALAPSAPQPMLLARSDRKYSWVEDISLLWRVLDEGRCTYLSATRIENLSMRLGHTPDISNRSLSTNANFITIHQTNTCRRKFSSSVDNTPGSTTAGLDRLTCAVNQGFAD